MLDQVRNRMRPGLLLFVSFAVLSCQQEAKKPESAPTKADSAAVSAQPAMLQAKLDEMKQNSASAMPADMVSLFQWGIDQVAASGMIEKAPKVGDTVSDFTLTNQSGKAVSLYQELAQGPAIVMWYRGGWCPYCNLTLAAMQQQMPAITAAGGQLIALTSEMPDSSMTTAERHALTYQILSDTSGSVARSWNLLFQMPDTVMTVYNSLFSLAGYNGNDRNELPLAASFVIGTDRVIRYAFVDADYRRRAEPAELVASLSALQQSTH